MTNIITEFKNNALRQFKIIPEEDNLYYIATRFFFDDGDEFVIYLAKEENKWVLTDKGHTYIYLSYTLEPEEIHQGRRGEIIHKILAAFDITDRNGELVLDLSKERYKARYGDALHNFIRAIEKISNVLYWKQYRTKPTFTTLFTDMLYSIVEKSRTEYNWHEPDRDTNKKYPVDYKINGLHTPLFLFTLTSDTKTRKATVILHQLKKWEVDFYSIGVLKDNKIDAQAQLHLQDICDDCIIGVPESANAISNYIDTKQ